MGFISVIHWSWNASHLAFLKFNFGTLSGTGWSDVFVVIMMGWWSLPNLSDKISHATSMYIEGWHKERSSKELVWWLVSNRVWTESFNNMRLWRSINFSTIFPHSFASLAPYKWLWTLKSPKIKEQDEQLLIILSNASSLSVSLGGTYTEATVYVLLLMVIQTATACKSAWNWIWLWINSFLTRMQTPPWPWILLL